jgi:predicted cupin superfamily sugar epimerase
LAYVFNLNNDLKEQTRIKKKKKTAILFLLVVCKYSIYHKQRYDDLKTFLIAAAPLINGP